MKFLKRLVNTGYKSTFDKEFATQIKIKELDEHEYFLMYINRLMKTPLFTPFLRLKMYGQIDEMMLQRALGYLQEKFLILRTGIKYNKNKAFFFKMEPYQAIPFLVINKTDSQQWIKIGIEESQKAFDEEKGLLTKVFLLKDKKGNDHDLIVIFDHTINDNISTLSFFHELLTIYHHLINDDLAKIDLSEIPIPICTYKTGVIDYYRNFKKPYTAKYKRKSNRFGTLSAWLKNLRTFFTKNKSYKECTILDGLLSKDETIQLSSSCAIHGISLPSLITAAYLISLKSFTSKPFSSSRPLNMRRFYDPPIGEKEIGYYVRTYMGLTFDPASSEGIWSLALKYNDEIANNALHQIFSSPPIFMPKNKFVQAILSKLLILKLIFTSLFTDYALSVINIAGKYNFSETYGSLKVEGLNWSGTHNFLKRYSIKHFCLSTIIINGELNLTFDSSLPYYESEIILKRILSLLREIINNQKSPGSDNSKITLERCTEEINPTVKKATKSIEKEFLSNEDHFLHKAVQDNIIRILSHILNKPGLNIDPNENISTYDIDSLNYTELSIALKDFYGLVVEPGALLQYKTVNNFVDYLVENYYEVLLNCHI